MNGMKSIFGKLGFTLMEVNLAIFIMAAGVLAMGFFATVGQICTTKSYAYGNLLLSSCLGFSAIPFSAVTGVLLFGDALQASSMLGMTLIVISGMAASVSTKREQARQKSEGAS